MEKKKKCIIGIICVIVVIVIVAILIPCIIIANRDKYEWENVEYIYDDYTINSEDYFVLTIDAIGFDTVGLLVDLNANNVVDVYMLDADNYYLFESKQPFTCLNIMDDITACWSGFGVYSGGAVYYFVIDNKNLSNVVFDLELDVTFKTIIIY